MKDRGVEWIGVIPEGWNTKRLSSLFDEVTEKVSDKDFPPLSVTKQGILPQIEGVAKTDNGDNRKLVRIGDFVINSRSDRKGSSGVSEYVGSVSLINIVFQPKEAVDMRYMHHLLRCCGFQEEFYRWGHGIVADLWTTNSSDAKNIILPTPSYEEQAHISCALDTKCTEIDKVVEQTRATIEEYKKLKQAIITEAVTKGVRGPRPMKPSGVEWIGDIPEEWYTSKAGRFIASTQNGLTRRDLSESSGDIVLKLRNITPEGTIDYSAVTRVKLSDVEKTAYTLEKGDFLFVRVNGSKSLVGKSAIFDGCDEIVAYNDHIIRVRLEPNYSRSYFKWFLLSTPGKTEIDMRTSTSAGQFTISGQELRNIRLCVPSEEEQQEISVYLDVKCAEIDRIIEKKEQLIEELGSYKKSLIYEYVTGKKEVTA